MIGLESRKVLLVDYDSEWIAYYRTEAELIKEYFRGFNN